MTTSEFHTARTTSSEVTRLEPDWNYVRIVDLDEELQSGTEAMCLLVRHSRYTSIAPFENTLRLAWAPRIALVAHLARHVAALAAELEERLARNSADD